MALSRGILVCISLLVTLEETLACSSKDVNRIATILLEVEDWSGLATELDIELGTQNKIKKNCRLSGDDIADCHRRKLVRTYCDFTGLEGEQVAENIAQALESIEHKKQANLIRGLYSTSVNSDIPNEETDDALTLIRFLEIISLTAIHSSDPTEMFQGTYFRTFPEKVKVNGKIAVATFNDAQNLTFVLPASGITLNDLLHELPQKLTNAVASMPSPVGDFRDTQIKNLTYGTTTNTLFVNVTLSQLTFIPEIMVVTDVTAAFTIKLAPINDSFIQALDFSSKWKLGTTSLSLRTSYDKNERILSLSAISHKGVSLHELGLMTIMDYLPSAVSPVEFTSLVGSKSSENLTLVFSGNITNKAQVHLVYQYAGNEERIAVAAEIQSFGINELCSSVQELPFFNSIYFPQIVVTLSKKHLVTALLPQVTRSSLLREKYNDTIPEGLSAKFESPVTGVKNSFYGSYEKNVFSFFIVETEEVTLRDLLSQFPYNWGIDTIPIFGDLLYIRVRSFSCDTYTKVMMVNMYLNEVKFYYDILSLHDISLKFHFHFSPISVTAESNSTIIFGKTNYSVSVARDPAKETYSLSMSTPNLNVLDYITSLTAFVLPENIHTALRDNLKFDIKNARLFYPFTKPDQMRLSGEVFVFGEFSTRYTAVTFKYGENVSIIVQKLHFSMVNPSSLLQHLGGNNSIETQFFGQETNDIQMILSPTTIVNEQNDLLSSLGETTVSEGITLRFNLRWPNNCQPDTLCSACQTYFSDAELKVEGTIINLFSYSLTAVVSDVKLGYDEVLFGASVKFQIGTTSSVSVYGNINIYNDIVIEASILTKEDGVKIEGSMTGCIKTPYSLQICHIYLSVSVPLTGSIGFGATVKIGNQTCGELLEGRFYGIKSTIPPSIAFSGKLNKINFAGLFKAFCYDIELPQVLADSGFPKGISVSFSIGEKTLPVGKKIPSGFHFDGAINVLGVEASTNISVNEFGFAGYIQLPLLKFTNAFSVYKSSSNTMSGPTLRVDLMKNIPIKIAGSMYVYILGIELETMLEVGDYLSFNASGKIFGLYEANLHIYAKYSRKLGISSTEFKVSGSYNSADLVKEINNHLEDGLVIAARPAYRSDEQGFAYYFSKWLRWLSDRFPRSIWWYIIGRLYNYHFKNPDVPLKAKEAIEKYNPAGVIHVDTIDFNDIELSVAETGKFICVIKGHKMGEPFTESLEIDTRNTMNSVKALADMTIEGLSDIYSSDLYIYIRLSTHLLISIRL